MGAGGLGVGQLKKDKVGYGHVAGIETVIC